ncbi:MAG: phage holin family protein [Anaerolineae bacterium]|nr:phage holin family protein [Anaerolineae bacterium]
MRLLVRWAIVAIALFVAAFLVPGIMVDSRSGWVVYAAMAIVLSLVNAFIRPLLKFLSCPLIILTLGLFTLIINAVTLLLASRIANTIFRVGFYVDGFWPAFWGSLIVSVVSVILNIFVQDDDEDRRSRRREHKN